MNEPCGFCGSLRATLIKMFKEHGLTTQDFQALERQATEVQRQFQKDREPILITQDGVPSAYLVGVEAFETLRRRMTLLEGIARGENAIEEGRSLTNKQARQKMARWLK